MEDFRKGNDLLIVWRIFSRRVEVSDGKYTEITEPYNLEGKDLKLVAVTSSRKIEIPISSVVGNELKSVYYGKDQQYTGEYSLTLIENDGKEGMHTLDECKAFRLVSRSCDIRDSDCECGCGWGCDCNDDNIEISAMVDLCSSMYIGISTPSGGGSSSIEVDAELSTTSTNPVQNKVVTSAINDVHKVATNASNIAKQASDDVDALEERVEGISAGGFVWQSVE